MRRGAWLGSALAMLGIIAVSDAHAQSTCVGDCRNMNEVGIGDLIVGVNISLGNLPITACEAFDCNHDGSVGINCLVQGVNNSLNGCSTGPTPTATPGGGTVERVYAIDPGVSFGSPSDTGTGLFTTGLGGSNAALAYCGSGSGSGDDPCGMLGLSPAEITLEMGTPNGSGVASLKLKEDVSLAVTVVDSTCLCLTLMAAGQGDGTIDCDGGTSYDVESVRVPNMPGFGWNVTTGQGPASPAGGANLLVMGLFERVMSDCVAADCSHHTFTTPANLFAFTTQHATAIQQTSSSPIIEEADGEPFSCANFADPTSPGRLAAPAPTTIDPIGDVANVFRLCQSNCAPPP